MDLRDVLDDMIAVDKRMQQRQSIAELQALAADARAVRCGNCNNWMRSRSCPLETNKAGMPTGPSSDYPGCLSFIRDPVKLRRSQELLAQADKEKRELE